MCLQQQSFFRRNSVNSVHPPQRGLRGAFFSILVLLFCSSCGMRSSSNIEDLSITKHKQRIILLQKKLHLAEKEEKKIKEKMERLSHEMRETELAYIRRRIDDYEELIQKTPSKKADFESASFFLKEREKLCKMIQASEASPEAQVVLDRILQLMMELDDVS